MDVGAALSRMSLEENGVRVLSVSAGSVTVNELLFPSGHRIAAFTPEEPYLAVLLDGAMIKTFGSCRWELGVGSVVTMPEGARHATQFSSSPTRVLTLYPHAHSAADGALSERRRLLDGSAVTVALRLGRELRFEDDAWSLAVEGVALELLAAVTRAGAPRRAARPPGWLRRAHALLHERLRQPVTVSWLAEEVGVDPSHLARCFRAHYGVSVGAYVRGLRLEWAARQLADGEVCIAAIAAQAGFADQSHLTRAFRRHTGVTPARYRAAARG